MNCILIVNRNGVFSALPSKEEFNAGGYLVTPSMFLTFEVEVNPDIYDLLYQFRANLIVVGPGLPLQTVDQITDPNHYYAFLQLGEPNTLDYAIIPEHVYLTYARQTKCIELDNAFNQAITGRFPCAMSGRIYYYNGDGLIASTMHFISTVQDGPILAAVDETGPLKPINHTPAQVMYLQNQYNIFYGNAQAKLFELKERVDSAEKPDQVAAIHW